MIMSMAVRNISRKRPRVICAADKAVSACPSRASHERLLTRRTDMPAESWVRTLSVPGSSAWMIALPVIPPRIWATVRRAARIGVSTPTRNMPRETAGLKRPPETLWAVP